MLTKKKERQLNILLNNANLMGEYDVNKLADLFINDGIAFADTGFSSLDIQLSFDTPIADQILGIHREEEEEVISDIETINKIKEQRKKGKEKANKKNECDFFRVIVFDSMQSMDEFLDHFGLDKLTRYVDGEKIKSFMGIGSDSDSDV
jgi:hypothetical protein